MSGIANEQELRQWIEALCERRIDTADCRRLESRLQADEAARRYFRDYFDLQAQLVWSFRRPIVAPVSPLLNKPIVSPTAKLSRRWMPTFAGTEFAIGALIMISVCAAFYGLVTYLSRERGTVAKAVHLRTAIAALTQTADCVWAAGTPQLVATPAKPVAIKLKEKLELVSGVAEITYRNGTKLTIEGPARVTIPSVSGCEMRNGRLVAYVPQAATGFTVETPRLTIVDLGTEFGVKSDGKDTADIVVFQGEVEVSAKQRSGTKNAGKDAIAPIRLKAGQSRRVSPQMVTVPREALDDEGVFIRKIADVQAGKPRRKKRFRLVSEFKPVTASSVWNPENGFFVADNVVDGRFDDTYVNGKHSWWMAADGVPADLTIDLEAEFQVSEIRLQNSHADYNDRGARHVRISLSSDGKLFSLVSEIELPDVAGQKLIEIQRITLATPMTARYVKLEISTFYGQGAGLNEVQVFAIESSGK